MARTWGRAASRSVTLLRTSVCARIGAGLVALAVLAVSGCGPGGVHSVESVDVVRPPTSGLAWIRDAAGQDLTLWVSLDGSPLLGQPIEGPLWADGHALWQPIVETVSVPLYDTPPRETQDRAGDRQGEMRRLVFRELVTDARVPVPDPPDVGAARAVEHELRLEGSVGPFVFWTSRVYLDAWGAHGVTQMSAAVWDLAAAAPSAIATERETRTWVEAQAPRLRSLPHITPNSTISPVALHPHWDLDHGLRVELRLAVDTCYACGDGEWSDYTRSIRHALDPLPERLDGRLPAWARVAAEQAEATLMGFTLVEHPEPARILDSLSR